MIGAVQAENQSGLALERPTRAKDTKAVYEGAGRCGAGPKANPHRARMGYGAVVHFTFGQAQGNAALYGGQKSASSIITPVLDIKNEVSL